VTRLERVDEASARLDREALLALHRLSVRLSRQSDARELVGAFSDAALEALPGASHVSVHLRGESGLACVASRNRRGSSTPAPLSRTLRDVVLAQGRAVAFRASDDAFSGAESLHEASVRAGLCAPLHDGERILGFVQVDQRDLRGAAMGRRELEVLVVLAQHLALALANTRMQAELQRACEESIRGLARALEAKDRYTAGHSDAVGDLCARVARRLGLPGDQVELMRRAALLHDIGKIGIPEGVLNKAERLTTEEFALLRSHPETGARILEPFTFLADLVPVVLHHHERWDGKGYPSGLAGEDIPLGARLLSAVDAYHSLVHDRAYRKGVGPELALWEVTRCSGTQFDPAIVDALAAEVEAERAGPCTLSLDAELAGVE
jgi:putative nucleotidyltransferase with HDIG domain